MEPTMSISSPELDLIVTNEGHSLLELSNKNAVMLVFLRHLGCIFCREAMRDIATLRPQIEGQNQQIVLVHMEKNDVAKQYFKKYNLDGIEHIEDPDCRLYERFGLTKGTFSQLFGLKNLIRGFEIGFSTAQFGGAAFGDAFQMPGIYVLREGRIEAQFVHHLASDRPDYLELLSCCTA